MNAAGHAWRLSTAYAMSTLGAPRHGTVSLARKVTATFNNSMQLLPLLLLPQQAVAEASTPPERTGPGPSCPPNPPAGWTPRGGAVAQSMTVWIADQRGWQRGWVSQIRLHRCGPPVAEEVCRVLPRPHNAAHLQTQQWAVRSREALRC